MKFGYKVSKCLTGLIKRYGTTHFLLNGLSCNLHFYKISSNSVEVKIVWNLGILGNFRL